MIVEIVILAMIAAFLGLRLYSVLGRRAEHEEEPIQGRFDGNNAGPAGAPRPVAPPRDTAERAPLNPALRQRDLPVTTPLECWPLVMAIVCTLNVVAIILAH